MKRILFLALFAMLWVANLAAQQTSGDAIQRTNILTNEGERLYLNGERMSLHDYRIPHIMTEEQYDTYRSAFRKCRAGKVLLISGGAALATGLVFLVAGIDAELTTAEGETYNSDATAFGAVVTFFSVGAIVPGIVLRAVGKHRMNNFVRSYNSSQASGATVTLGCSMMTAPTPAGGGRHVPTAGVAINF